MSDDAVPTAVKYVLYLITYKPVNPDIKPDYSTRPETTTK